MACFFIIDVYIDENKGRGSYDDYIEKVKPIVESYGGGYSMKNWDEQAEKIIIERFGKDMGIEAPV